MSDTRIGGGLGLGGWMFIVFLTLKLLGKIDWSWWWVTSPLWIPALIVLAVWGFILAIGSLAWALANRD